VPKESVSYGCMMEPHQAANIIRLSSSQFARFGIRYRPVPLQVKAGERYKMSARITYDNDFRKEEWSPGVVLRATLFSSENIDFSGGHFYASAAQTLLGDPSKLAPVEVRKTESIEGIVEIPQGVSQMKFFVFCWYTSGGVTIQSASIEKLR
jgi:hypothetical protein